MKEKERLRKKSLVVAYQRVTTDQRSLKRSHPFFKAIIFRKAGLHTFVYIGKTYRLENENTLEKMRNKAKGRTMGQERAVLGHGGI